MKKTYSVELEAAAYADDTFTGSLEACKNYIEENEYKLGEDCQIALIVEDEKGIAEDTLDIIDTHEKLADILGE